MKVLQTVSDDSKAVLDEPVEVIINRPGYSVVLGNHTWACPARFDLGADELDKFLKKITWQKNDQLIGMPHIEIPKV